MQTDTVSQARPYIIPSHSPAMFHQKFQPENSPEMQQQCLLQNKRTRLFLLRKNLFLLYHMFPCYSPVFRYILLEGQQDFPLNIGFCRRNKSEIEIHSTFVSVKVSDHRMCSRLHPLLPQHHIQGTFSLQAELPLPYQAKYTHNERRISDLPLLRFHSLGT